MYGIKHQDIGDERGNLFLVIAAVFKQVYDSKKAFEEGLYNGIFRSSQKPLFMQKI